MCRQAWSKRRSKDSRTPNESFSSVKLFFSCRLIADRGCFQHGGTTRRSDSSRARREGKTGKSKSSSSKESDLSPAKVKKERKSKSSADGIAKDSSRASRGGGEGSAGVVLAEQGEELTADRLLREERSDGVHSSQAPIKGVIDD